MCFRMMIYFNWFISHKSIGTDEERGINVWRKVESDDTSGSLENSNTSGYACYDLPFGMSAIRKSTWLKYIPISPTFDGCNTCTGSSKGDGAELNGVVVDRGYEGDNMDLRQRKNTDASSTQLWIWLYTYHICILVYLFIVYLQSWVSCQYLRK